MKKAVSLGASILLTLFVFGMSLRSGPQSAALSSPLAQLLEHLIAALFPRLDVDFDQIHMVVRKGAHMTEYAALGVSYMITARTWRHAVWPVVLAGALVAFLDEGLQTFVAQRSPAVLDALAFDIPGFVLGTGAAALVIRRIAAWKIRQKSNVS